MKCVVSVLGKDRSGIVAEVATALAACGANIDDISQTILGEGEIFSRSIPRWPTSTRCRRSWKLWANPWVSKSSSSAKTSSR